MCIYIYIYIYIYKERKRERADLTINLLIMNLCYLKHTNNCNVVNYKILLLSLFYVFLSK